MSPFGLTPTQFSALIKIAELGVCGQNQLARQTKMDVATAKGVVDRLSEKGLICFTGDPKDRRRKVIALSRQGEQAIPELHSFGRKVSELTLSSLPPEERPAALELLAKLT